MLHGFLGRNSCLGIVKEDSTEEIEELLVETSVGRNDVLWGEREGKKNTQSAKAIKGGGEGEMVPSQHITHRKCLHRIDVSLRPLGRIPIWIIQSLSSSEISVRKERGSVTKGGQMITGK